MRGMGFGAIALGAVVVSATAGCHTREAVAEAPSAHCTFVSKGFGPPGLTPVKAEIVASGLEVPWGIAFLPSGDMLVTERPGRIRIVRRDGEVMPPVATLPIGSSSEGGLLGIALDPQFANTRAFYVYHTIANASGVENRVERWHLAPDEKSAAMDRVLLQGIAGARFHDGGRLRFGPDGMLYVGTGDARQPDRAQQRDSLNGKLLRVDRDGNPPRDNPFPNSPVFLLGIRNTEGFDWLDPRTIVLADHGPSGELGRSGHDEVDVAHPGDNLGWPTIYGCEAHNGMVAPSLSWETAVPPGGAAIYTGDAIPAWKGSLIVGTLGSTHLHRVVLAKDDPRKVVSHEVYFEGDPPTGFGRLRDVVMGPDHELYVTTSNCDGRGNCPPTKDAILRITAGTR